jgi:HEAT repeat protein
MPSRLSSLLVSDGVVSVKRMEHAFQRQVIYGGSLDTILLEMGIVPEERLVQYLSKATGLPPATREETEGSDPGVVERCPMDLAKIYRVVPLCFAEGALRILVQDPVEMAVLEELANELEVPVQPLVVPEYRFHVVFTRMYGGTADARYETLARRAEESKPSQPVGKARTIIVDTTAGSASPDAVSGAAQTSGGQPTTGGEPEAARAEAGTEANIEARPEARPETKTDTERRPLELEPPRRREKRTMQMATAALAQRGDDERPPRRERASTEPGMGVPPVWDTGHESDSEPHHGPSGERDDEPTGWRATPAAGPARGALAHQDTAPLGPHAEDEPTWRDAAPIAATPDAPGLARAAAQAAPDPLATALSPAAAMEALPRAEDRDSIFNLLLRAMRHRVRYAALFTVQERSAIGRIAIDGDAIDRAAIARVVIPLDAASPFRTVVSSVAPYFGPLATGALDIDGPLAGLGGRLAAAALLLPIVLRGRVVAIAMGHGGQEALDASALAALLPVASRAAEAISRLIVKTKATRLGQSGGVLGGLENEPSGPVRAATAPGARPGTFQDDTQPIASVLAAVQSEDAAVARTARAAALSRPAETLAALVAEFPGALRLERYELEGRQATAAEHGPLLELIVALGAAAGDLLVEKMRDPDRDVRYYATLCAGESRPGVAVDSLVDRLFDGDYGTRSVAIDALSGYPAADREQALQRVRQALRGDSPARVHAAANALAKLGDAAAVPVLIELLDTGTEAAEHARRALIMLTMEDCGTGARVWRAWWERHRGQHRIEWLIEALGHRDDNLRSAAAEELLQLTGEHLGYHHDQPQSAREQAQQRWLEWWQRVGSQRFTAGG